MMRNFAESRIDEPRSCMKLFVVPAVVAFLIFLSVVFLYAEEPIQMASIGQYNSSNGYMPVPEEGIPAEKTAAPQNDADIPDGIDAVSCAIFGNIPAFVEGPTDVEFWWRGSDAGVLIFTLNNKIQAIQYKDSGWQKFTMSINGQGTYKLKWIYKNAAEAQAAIQQLSSNL